MWMITKVRATYIETILFPVGIYLFKVNYKITRKRWEKCPKLTKKDNRTTSIDMNTQLIDVALVSFSLTLDIFCFLFSCFLCLLWTSKCEVGILLIRAYDHAIFKRTVMQIEKSLINDRLRVSKVSRKFRIPTIYDSAVIYPWDLLFS